MRNIQLRHEVIKFAEKMELALQENEHKGDWEDSSEAWLLSQLGRHFEKSKLASGTYSGSDTLVNIANYAMMIERNKTLNSIRNGG